jgi:hypothetical protein
VSIRERDLVDSGMRDKRLADLRAAAGEDIEYAGREAGVNGQRGELERRHRRVLGWLGDDRAAGGQRGRELPHQEQQRRVPRNDRRHHPDGLVACVGVVAAVLDREHLAP